MASVAALGGLLMAQVKSVASAQKNAAQAQAQANTAATQSAAKTAADSTALTVDPNAAATASDPSLAQSGRAALIATSPLGVQGTDSTSGRRRLLGN